MSTDSFKPTLRELDDAGQWKHRRGRVYVLSKYTSKEAGGIMFKCGIASFLSDPAIHLILFYIALYTLLQKFTLPDPDSPHFQLFIDTLLAQEWRNRVLHHNVWSAVNSAIDCVVFFKKQMEEKGGDLLGSIMRSTLITLPTLHLFLLIISTPWDVYH